MILLHKLNYGSRAQALDVQALAVNEPAKDPVESFGPKLANLDIQHAIDFEPKDDVQTPQDDAAKMYYTEES